MKLFYLYRKTIQVFFIFMTTTMLVFTPLLSQISMEDGSTISLWNTPKAHAIADVGILQTQNLNAFYNESTGELVLDINGVPLLSLGLISNQQFVYQLPVELGFILGLPGFKAASRIEVTEPLLAYGTIPGNAMSLDSATRTVKGSYVSLLNLSLILSVSAKLIINLDELGLTELPPSPDGKLEFYGFAADNSLITLDILVSEGAYDEIATGVLLLPPVLESVTDVSTSITGTGIVGATIHIDAPTGTYQGIVDPEGKFSVPIPVQAAGTVITAFQSDSSGNSSGTTSTIVIGTILELTVPSEIRFKSTAIGFHEVTIPREIPELSLRVVDTRGQGFQWRIKARALTPLTSSGGYTIDPTALIFVDANQVSYLKDETLIYEGQTGVNQETTITWNDNEGLLLRTIPSNVKIDSEYSTTINWTLENAP